MASNEREYELSLQRLVDGTYGTCVDCRRQIDRERLAARPLHQVREKDARGAVVVAGRGRGIVGREQDVRHLPQRRVARQRLLLEDIEIGTAELPVSERRDDGGLVHQAPARDVDETRAAGQARERGGVDEALGLGCEGAREDQPFRARQESCERGRRVHLVDRVIGARGRAPHADHAHAERAAEARDAAADRPQADDQYRLTLQVARSRIAAQGRPLVAPLRRPPVRKAAGEHQQAAERGLRHRVAVGSGRSGELHPAPCQRGHEREVLDGGRDEMDPLESDRGREGLDEPVVKRREADVAGQAGDLDLGAVLRREPRLGVIRQVQHARRDARLLRRRFEPVPVSGVRALGKQDSGHGDDARYGMRDTG